MDKETSAELADIARSAKKQGEGNFSVTSDALTALALIERLAIVTATAIKRESAQ